jgi:O-antigen/teichoic acid export membrane protein
MGLIRQSAILGFARFTNFAVMFVTPLLMVRLLDVQAYGQYREFMLYASVLVSFLSLAIKDNLNYFVSVRPQDALVVTSHTLAMLLIMSVLGSAVLLLGQDWLLSRASFDFLWPLLIYALLVINFDVLENYWLGRQQARNVLVYSTFRVLLRVLSVLLATYLTRDLQIILWSLVAAESLKAAVCIVVLARLRLVTICLDRELLIQQLRFIVPLSAGGLLYFANEKIGQVYISATAGAAALAIYTVGTYQLPIIAIARSAVADTLFPEMSRHFTRQSNGGLALWKIGNLYYAYIVLPAFCVLFVFAEEFIRLLFTAAYIDAVPVFRIALLVMLRQTFEMGTPLRAANQNSHMVWANVMAVICHIPLLVLLIPRIGISGAAVAWMVGDLVNASYLASRTLRAYKIRWRELVLWPQTVKLVLAALLPLPLLLFAGKLPYPLLAIPVAIALYGLAYLAITARMRIPEIDKLSSRLGEAVRGRLPRRGSGQASGR